jgi:hypothetical protein
MIKYCREAYFLNFLPKLVSPMVLFKKILHFLSLLSVSKPCFNGCAIKLFVYLVSTIIVKNA